MGYEAPKCKRCGYRTSFALCPNCLGNSETGEGPIRTQNAVGILAGSPKTCRR